MAPPIGHKPYAGAGRRSNEFEEKEWKRLAKILSHYLNLLEKKKITPEDKEKILLLEKAALKIMDKRHANKSQIDLDSPLLDEAIKNNTELVRDLIESFKDGRRKKTTLPETPPPV
jgi:hypothetical protein